MNNLDLKVKLKILVGILLLFCAIVGVVGVRSARNISASYGVIEKENLPNSIHLLRALAEMRMARLYLAELALPHGDEKNVTELKHEVESALENFKKNEDAYMESLKERNNSDENELAQAIHVTGDTVLKDVKKGLEYVSNSNGKEGPAMDSLRNIINVDLKGHGAPYRVATNNMLEFQTKNATDNGKIAADAKSWGEKMIISGIIFALVLGGGLALFVLKNIAAEQSKAAITMAAAMKSHSMIHSSPINIMTATPDGQMNYMNEASVNQLKKLQQFLPEKAENLVGRSIDILHKNPAVQKRIIADPKNLPHRAVISVGPETLNLLVGAIIDDNGKYLGPMVTWDVVTDKVELVRNLAKASDDLALAANNVLNISSNLSASAEETSAQSNTASIASEEVNAGVQAVAQNMEQMVDAIKQITKTTSEAASMTNEAMGMAKNTNQIINKLGDSSMDIGNVIKVISSIAQQTNLLALNATIEAARAGEAGKGFAVVANEVKELANQTAKATNEIIKKIETIQTDSKNAIHAISEISDAIDKVNGFTSNIAAAVEEQAATTNEVTRVVTESAIGVKQINENISQVSIAATNTGKDAGSAHGAAKGVGDIAIQLKDYVTRLKV